MDGIESLERPQTKRVLVVIPALNEAETIADVVQEVRSTYPAADVLVVDDGSTDSTATIAERCGVHVARLPFNVGVGGAMRTGFKYALREGYSAVVQVDADGQHDPRFIPQLVDALDSADVVVGSRFAQAEYKMGSHRRLATHLLAEMTSRVTQTAITDSTSGFRAHSRRAIDVYADHYPCEYLGDTVESLMIARKTRLKVLEIPVVMRHRTSGTPSQGFISSVRYVARAFATTAMGLTRQWPTRRGLS